MLCWIKIKPNFKIRPTSRCPNYLQNVLFAKNGKVLRSSYCDRPEK
jgi:hypothetical protein